MIRHATETDVPVIKEWLDKYYVNSFKRHLNETVETLVKRHVCLVDEVDGAIVAMCGKNYAVEGAWACLQFLIVDENLRESGKEEKLLESFENELPVGIKDIEVMADPMQAEMFSASDYAKGNTFLYFRKHR